MRKIHELVDRSGVGVSILLQSPTAVNLVLLETSAATLQRCPAVTTLIALRQCLPEHRQVGLALSHDGLGKRLADGFCLRVNLSFLALEPVGRVPSRLIDFRLRGLDEATGSRRRSLIGSERRSIGRGGRLPGTRCVGSVLIPAARRDTKHDSYQRNQDVPAHSASIPQGSGVGVSVLLRQAGQRDGLHVLVQSAPERHRDRFDPVFHRVAADRPCGGWGTSSAEFTGFNNLEARNFTNQIGPMIVALSRERWTTRFR